MAQVGSLYTSLSLESSSFVTNLKRSIRQAEDFAESTERSLGRVKTAATGMIAAFAIDKAMDFVRGLTATVDAASAADAQLRLATKSGAEFAAMQRSAATAAKDFGRSYNDTVQLSAAIARSTQQMGLGLRDQEGLIRSILANIKISGASTDAVNNAMTQFRQAMEGGIFRAEEFNSINENTPQILRAVAQGLGVTSGGLRQMMLDGKLSAETVAQALIKVRETSEEQAATIPPRWDQAWTRVTDISRTAIVRFDEGGEFSRILLGFADRGSKSFEGIGDSAEVAGRDVRAALMTLGDVFDPLIQAGDRAIEKILSVQTAVGTAQTLGDKVLRFADSASAPLRALGPGVLAGYNSAQAGGSFFGGWSKFMSDTSMAEEVQRRFAANRQALATAADQRKAEIARADIFGASLIPDDFVKRVATPAAGGSKGNKSNARSSASKNPELSPADTRWNATDGRQALPTLDMGSLANLESIKADIQGINDLVGQTNIADIMPREEMQRIDQMATQLASTMTSTFEDALFNGQGLRSVFGGLLEDVGRMIIRFTVLEPLARSVADAMKGTGGGGGFGGLIGGATKFASGLFGGARAGGGTVASDRMYLVGERGPELFAPGRTGTVIPNHVAAAMNGNVGSRAISVVVNAQDAVLASTVAQWVRQGVEEAAVRGAAGGSALAQEAVSRAARRRLA